MTLGSGSDYGAVKYSELGGDLSIAGGSGGDAIYLNSAVADNATIRTAGGNDTIAATYDLDADRLNVITGAGNDRVEIDSSELNDVQIRLGGGDDTLDVSRSTLVGVARGNAGNDGFFFNLMGTNVSELDRIGFAFEALAFDSV